MRICSLGLTANQSCHLTSPKAVGLSAAKVTMSALLVVAAQREGRPAQLLGTHDLRARVGRLQRHRVADHQVADLVHRGAGRLHVAVYQSAPRLSAFCCQL